jgi:hypothetical protein
VRRLFEAAFLPESGHRRSIACSLCSRCPGARARSFTKVAAFLSRQASWVMVLESTLARNPPSNRTLAVLRFSLLATSDRLTRSRLEESIPLRPHLRFASALFHLQNALCRWRHAVHLTAFVGASIHVYRLPPDLRLPFGVSGLGLPLCSCERSAQILTAGTRLGRVCPHRRWPTKDQRCPRNTMPPASENW